MCSQTSLACINQPPGDLFPSMNMPSQAQKQDSLMRGTIHLLRSESGHVNFYILISQAPCWDLQHTHAQTLICKPILIALALPNWHLEQNWADNIINKPRQLSTNIEHKAAIVMKAQTAAICLPNDATSNGANTARRELERFPAQM
jgi:hypothetical protein